MARVAVVGGAGFVGRHVVRRVLASGREVVTLDVRRPPMLEVGEAFTAIDASDDSSVREAAASLTVEGVVWLPASIRQSREVDETAITDVQVMAVGLCAFLDAMPQPPRSLVYAGSIDVYGAPGELPVDERHPTVPLTAYGAAKLCGENYARIAGHAIGARVAVLRIAFVYGPGQHEDNVIPVFLRQARAGRRPVVYGGGRDIRDDVHVRDVARAVVLALEAEADGIFNVSSGTAHTIADVARSICRATGGDLAPIIEDTTSSWTSRWFSIDAARQAFGYEPNESFDEAIREMLETTG